MKFSKKTYVIAEIGVNHNNNISLAQKMITSAKKSGADAVKFQTFKASNFVTKYTPKAEYQKKNTDSSLNHYNMIRSLELSTKNHIKLKNFCKKIKIDFLSTPYDIESAKFLKKIGCNVFKTSSADIVDLELHSYLAKSKKKIIISTGMSNIKEIKECLEIYKKFLNKNYILLHCVSNYPCSLKSLNLKALELMKKKFNCDVGFSDHTIGYQAAVTSVCLGASIVEKHFTLNKNLMGPDHKASANPKEFKKMVNEIRKTELILGKCVKKCQTEEKEMAKVSRKSLTLNRNLKKNEILKRNFLTLKRPGTGNFYNQIENFIGRKSKRSLKIDYQIKNKDFY